MARIPWKANSPFHPFPHPLFKKILRAESLKSKKRRVLVDKMSPLLGLLGNLKLKPKFFYDDIIIGENGH
jgi:hypothetical protein